MKINITNILLSFILFTTVPHTLNATEAHSAHSTAVATDSANILKSFYYSCMGAGVSEEDLKKDSLIKLTSLSEFVKSYKMNKPYTSKEKFNFYTYIDSRDVIGIGSPYDTIITKSIVFENTEKYIKEKSKNKDRVKDSIEFVRACESSVKSGKFSKLTWKEVREKELAVYKELLPDILYNDIKKAMYELHDSLNLSWEDTVYVHNGALASLANTIKEGRVTKDAHRYKKWESRYKDRNASIYKRGKETNFEKQTEYAKRGKKSPIKLLSHKIKGTIKTEKEKSKLIEKFFATNSYVALKTGEGEVQYGIFRIKDIKAALPETEKNIDHFAAIKNILQNIVETGMSVAELEWEYKNKKYKTTAIISKDNKIIYDNVGTIASVDFLNTRLNKELFRYKNTKKDYEKGLHIIQPLPFERSKMEINLFGDVKYFVQVFCNAFFHNWEWYDEQQIIEKSFSDPFHSCKAEIINPQRAIKEYKFNWTIAHKELFDALVWNNGKICINKEEYSETGAETQTPEWW